MSTVPTRFREHFENIKGVGFIYFVGNGDFIKIGYSQSIGSRLTQLFTSLAEPEVIWIERGDVRQEKVFHRHFASARVRREWFRKTPELIAFLRQRRQIHYPDEPLPNSLSEEAER